MSELSVDLTAFRASARPFDLLADDFQRAVTQLTAAIAQEGTCWGGDDTGSAFAGKYVTGAHSAVEMLSQTPELLEEVASRIREDADAYRDFDDRFSTGLDRLGGQ